MLGAGVTEKNETQFLSSRSSPSSEEGIYGGKHIIVHNKAIKYQSVQSVKGI